MITKSLIRMTIASEILLLAMAVVFASVVQCRVNAV